MLSIIRFIAVSAIVVAASAQDIITSQREFTPVERMQAADWTDADEINRTWQHAVVHRPQAGGDIIKSSITELSAEKYSGEKYPTIIYLHGCNGLWEGSFIRMDMLSQAGYAVIAPNSLARNKYPESCDTQTHSGGLYRYTLKMRQQDALNAITKAKQLAWVDAKNVSILGFSEGGITVATLIMTKPEQQTNARVIEGWTCHAGWPEYQGLNAQKFEPVMSLVAKYDPWFQADWARGECGKFMHPNNGSVSIEIEQGQLAYGHGLLQAPALQTKVLTFLDQHRN